MLLDLYNNFTMTINNMASHKVLTTQEHSCVQELGQPSCFFNLVLQHGLIDLAQELRDRASGVKKFEPHDWTMDITPLQSSKMVAKCIAMPLLCKYFTISNILSKQIFSQLQGRFGPLINMQFSMPSPCAHFSLRKKMLHQINDFS